MVESVKNHPSTNPSNVGVRFWAPVTIYTTRAQEAYKCGFAHSKAAARLLGIEVCTGKTKTS